MENKSLYMVRASPRLTFPKMMAYDCVNDYIQSKAFQQMVKIYPEFDVVRMDEPKSYLAMLNIKLQGIERILNFKRTNLVEIRKDLDEQWQDLNEKEKALKTNFKHFNAFIKENKEKRERAKKKIKDDAVLLEQRKKEISECLLNFTNIKTTKFELDKKIKEYRIYEAFLNKVVESADEFVSIQDMINRYMSLLSAKNHLARIQENNLRALENAKSDMMKLTEEKNFILMGLNNQIANLQTRFENAKIKSLECEQLVLQVKNNAVKQLSEIEEVKCSIWNIYSHMMASKDISTKVSKDNVEDQMMYIKRTLTELAKVNQMLRKRANRGTTISKKEKAKKEK